MTSNKIIAWTSLSKHIKGTISVKILKILIKGVNSKNIIQIELNLRILIKDSKTPLVLKTIQMITAFL